MKTAFRKTAHGSTRDLMGRAGAGMLLASALVGCVAKKPQQSANPCIGCNAGVPTGTYNPTDRHRHQADSHTKHALQQEVAAEVLASFEVRGCRFVHVSARPLCLLRGVMKSAESNNRGVRLIWKNEADDDNRLARALCHHAFGAHCGHRGMPGCPLSLEGTGIEKTLSGAIDVTSYDLDTVTMIRKCSKLLVEQ